MKTDIAVLGGGASGLAAAIAAKEANMAADVTVIEKLPRIPSAITEKCFIFNNLDIPFLQQHVLRQGTLKEYPEVFHFKGFEYENLAARQKGSDDLE